MKLFGPAWRALAARASAIRGKQRNIARLRLRVVDVDLIARYHSVLVDFSFATR